MGYSYILKFVGSWTPIILLCTCFDVPFLISVCIKPVLGFSFLYIYICIVFALYVCV